MKKIIIMLCLLLTNQVRADEWSLQINGISRHQGQCRIECNENNSGLGIQYDWLNDEDFIKSFTAGTLINSLNDRSWYVGGVWQYKMGPVGAGLFYGLVYYPTEKANLWPAPLPMLSLNYKHVGMNAIYIPAVDEKIVPAWLFQLIVPLR